MRQTTLATLLLAVAGLPALAQAPASAPVVEQAWARATTASAHSGGIFLTLRNTGPADQLVSADTPAAQTAELHQTTDDNGVMKMDAVPQLPLPAGQTVTLQPGGLHIMLIGLTHPLNRGDSFPVTLHFVHAPPVTTVVHVGTAGASAPP